MIRRALPVDAETIAALWNTSIRDTVVTFNSTEKTVAEVAALIDSRHAEGHLFLVAEGEAGVLGFASYAQFRGGSGYATCMEHSILLGPAARGMGFGRQLMAALEDHARNAGAHQMIAGVSGENIAGRDFHARLGYKLTGTVPEAGYKFGRFLDLLLMQKILS